MSGNSGAYSQYINSPIDLRIPQTPEGITDPRLGGQLMMVYNALRQLQIGITQLTGAVQQDASVFSMLLPSDTILAQNANRLYVQATEKINGGAMVNLYSNGGSEVVARNANAATSLQAMGFCNMSNGIEANAYGEVIVMQGLCNLISSMTPGDIYYLAGSAGGIINGKPGSGVVQQVGIALTANLLYFNTVNQ